MNQELFALAQQDLAALEAELLLVVDSPVDLVHKISDHLVQAGGKRLRPALYFLCARSGGGQPATMMPLATAIEMIHMATLVHDDVVDSSHTRRGSPTANSLWGNQMSVLNGRLFVCQGVFFDCHAGESEYAASVGGCYLCDV